MPYTRNAFIDAGFEPCGRGMVLVTRDGTTVTVGWINYDGRLLFSWCVTGPDSKIKGTGAGDITPEEVLKYMAQVYKLNEDFMRGPKQRGLENEVEALVRETHGYDDALQYVQDIADDIQIDVEEVIQELKRQCGRAESDSQS